MYIGEPVLNSPMYIGEPVLNSPMYIGEPVSPVNWYAYSIEGSTGDSLTSPKSMIGEGLG